MWFKNLTLLRLQRPGDITLEKLEERLAEHAYHPVGALETSSEGWCPPLGKVEAPWIQRAPGGALIALRREDKVLPAAAIRERVALRVDEIESREHRKLGRKAREAVRDEIIRIMLPQAFSQSRTTFAYLDLANGWLMVDTPSVKRAEDLVAQLRKTLEGFPVRPITTRERPMTVLTRWISGINLPQGVELESECELKSPETDGGIVKARRHDLFAPEITRHVEAGKEVSRLALNWSERMSLILDENLSVRRLRFLQVMEESDSQTGDLDEASRFDQELALMALELGNFVPILLDWFGGEASPEVA